MRRRRAPQNGAKQATAGVWPVSEAHDAGHLGPSVRRLPAPAAKGSERAGRAAGGAGGAADEDRNGDHIGGACYAYFSAISMPSGASGPTGMKSKSIRPAWPIGRPCTWVLAASTDSALNRNTPHGAASLDHICSLKRTG